MVAEYELDRHTMSITRLIVDNTISTKDKIKLLTIKLEWILRGNFSGKKRAFVGVMVSIIIIAAR